MIIAVLALAISTASLTITRSGVFAWARRAVKRHSAFFGELIECPYCTSHWLALAAVLIYQPRVTDAGVLVLDLFVSVLVLVALSSLISGLVYRSISGIYPSDG
jgi:hypothetical protein